nr:hypothetical protein CFP56_34956 [Quercus suber]
MTTFQTPLKMPYSRDEIAAEIKSFYEFLVSNHLPSEALKLPPPEGWPGITAERLGFLEKSDTVIDLLKHIPYIRQDEHGTQYQIFESTACNDFSGTWFEKTGIDFHDENATEPMLECKDEDTEEMFEPYMATLARAAQGDNGWHLFCDTRDGSLELADITVGTKRWFNNARDCFEFLKREYYEFNVYACGSDDVTMASGQGGDTKYKEIYNKYGWLTPHYNKSQCLAELEQLRCPH